MVMHFETTSYDEWKRRFDSDPVGRRQTATGHIVSRAADDPNQVFVRVEFDSVATARAFRERLLESGALDNPFMSLKTGPTVIETVDTQQY
jgi:hypothetical protein